MNDKGSDIYLKLLEEEVEKFASGEAEKKILLEKAQTLLALAMRSAAVDIGTIKNIVEGE